MALNAEKTKLVEKTWKKILSEAKAISKKEPLVEDLLKDKITSRQDMTDCLAYVLSSQLQDANLKSIDLYGLFHAVLKASSHIVYEAVMDMYATFDRDAACTHLIEPLIFFKGCQAIQTHRIAYCLWNRDRKFLAKLLQASSSRCYEVDIHPAAKIGKGILVDHATNIVIGETAKVGDNVSILHGVTLGGTGKDHADRHPKIGAGVMIGAHAQLLGNIKIGRGAKIGAGAVVLNDVPAHTTCAGVPAVKVGKPNCDMPALNMIQNFIEE